MTLDGFLGRRYDRRHYNCAHLSIDIWEYVHGRCVAAALAGFLTPGQVPARLGHAEGVVMLPAPRGTCFVLMRSLVRPPHVGVLHDGSVMHFAGNHTVQYQPPEVATLGYTKVRYFTC